MNEPMDVWNLLFSDAFLEWASALLAAMGLGSWPLLQRLKRYNATLRGLAKTLGSMQVYETKLKGGDGTYTQQLKIQLTQHLPKPLDTRIKTALEQH